MTDQEEFEIDRKTKLTIELGQTIYNNTINDLRAKIKQQTKELVVLRGFAQVALSNKGISMPFENMLLGLAQGLKLIDENGNPTKLLTGEK